VLRQPLGGLCGQQQAHPSSFNGGGVSQMAGQEEEGLSLRTMRYLHLNVIDNYNDNMNQTDIANQLQGHHRPDHWMHHKK
jgi:hypothetical protein